MAFRTWVFSALAVFFLVLLAWAWEVHKAEQSLGGP